MERKEYLERCQYGETVTYEGTEYTAESYVLWFRDGKPQHSAEIKKNNTILRVRLEDLK